MYVHNDVEKGVRTILGEVTVPSEDLPTAPKQPHLVYGGMPSKMRVMYVSSANTPSPMVKYWKSTETDETSMTSIGTSETYSESNMCEAPSNQVAQNLYRNPGIKHIYQNSNPWVQDCWNLDNGSPILFLILFAIKSIGSFE